MEGFSSKGWTHAVWIFDGKFARIYINGHLKGSHIRNFNTAQTGVFRIGGYLDGNGYWTGDIDDVRIYDRALSKTEVVQLYQWESD